jgi:outer membrane protein
MLWLRLGAGLLGALAVSSMAQGVDLAQAYQAAWESDPVLAAAKFTLQAAREKVPEARSDLLPAVRATGNGGKTSGLTIYTDTPEVRRGFHSYAWEVQLTQPVLRIATIYGFSESKAIVRQADAQFSQARQELLLRLAQAYFAVLAAKETESAALAQLKAMELQLLAARRSFEKGVASITDVDDATSRAEQARSQESTALRDVETQRAELERITGPIEGELSALRADARIRPPEPNELSRWTEQARQNHPAVLAQEAALEAARLEIGRARSQRLPSVDLTAAYGANYSSGNIINPIDYSTRVRDWQVNLQVSVPLLDGGGMHAQVAEAVAKRSQAEAEVESARRHASSDARAAYAALLDGIRQVEALQAAVAAAESSVKGNTAGFQAGLKITLDVLTAEQQLFSVRRDLAKARYDALIASLKLKAAAGELLEADLFSLNGLLVAPPSS